MTRRLYQQRRWSWSASLTCCLLATALLASAGALPGWAQEAQVLDGIAAVVNDEIITIGEVREVMALELEQLAQLSGGSGLQERQQVLFRRTLQALVDIRLQLARARKLQLQVTEEDVNRQVEALKAQNQISEDQLVQMLKSRGMTLETYRQQVQESLLVAKLVNAEVRSRLVIQDTELREMYQARQEQFKNAGEQTISHILFPVPVNATTADEEQLRQQAEGVLQQLRTGANFAALARQYSEGPSAERGGLLGTFKPGELLPAFETAASKLKPGEISDVVRTQVGWHIIRVDARQGGEYRSFDDVKADLTAELLRTKGESKYQEWLEALRQQAYIKVLYEG
jgi:parvulin-like peptidyl-prolyl isomerase